VYVGGFIGYGTIPFESSVIYDHQIFAMGRSMSGYVSMNTPAFAAVALDHIPQRTAHFILYRPAETTTGGLERCTIF
jgi:hypothetical protein